MLAQKTDARHYQKGTDYDGHMKGEDIPIHTGNSVNAFNLELGHWKRAGIDAAFVDLPLAEQLSGCMVWEIPAGHSTKLQRHLYEIYFYVLQGSGETAFENPDGPRQTFQWKDMDFFTVPLNVPYEISAGRDGPARFYVVNSAPLMVNLLHNDEFIFNNDFVFTDRYNGEEDYFYRNRTVSQQPFIADMPYAPNIRNFDSGRTVDDMEGNNWGRRVQLEPAHSSMAIHFGEEGGAQPVGMYNPAHRHQACYLLQLRGEGFSMVYYGSPGDELIEVDWEYGTIFAPGTSMFHHHFNLGSDASGHLAIKWHNNLQHPQFKQWKIAVPVREGGDRLPHEDEPPEIRVIFQAELDKRGLPNLMPMVGAGR